MEVGAGVGCDGSSVFTEEFFGEVGGLKSDKIPVSLRRSARFNPLDELVFGDGCLLTAV